ncbi:fasciculation and elongation protein zeta-2 [Gambusia affinis]|uniref:fasciculation and elongation protein zeta-2 n=1 Tax=Gambusia affinis TaxID=33528 RepID=UPI001CDB6CB8|nr:fasciculation and elongation protein zeta-2 [Gambusia affinis]
MVDMMTDSLEFWVRIPKKNLDPFLKAWKVSQNSAGSSSDELVSRHASSLQVSEEIHVHPEPGARCILEMPPDGWGVLALSLPDDIRLPVCLRLSNVSMDMDCYVGAKSSRFRLRTKGVIGANKSERVPHTNEWVWNSLTNNYGNVMPVDWKTSYTRSLHLPALKLKDQEGQKTDNQSLDLSDDEDEELREQLDMHSIIVSCINEEPLFTAEQVIEEIEEMMQESPDPDDDESPSQSDLSMLSQDLGALKRSGSNTSFEERLRQLSVSELSRTLEEVEAAIRRYSEELIQALALRDELDFEKEVKNSFISLLIDVQNKQKEHRELQRKKKKIRSTTTTGPNGQRTNSTHIPGTLLTLEGLSNVIQNGLRQTFGHSGGDKQYLTTVIPYEKKAGSPSVEDLQILTKILHAMRDDSEKVPALLTDYILKVLCPT